MKLALVDVASHPCKVSSHPCRRPGALIAVPRTPEEAREYLALRQAAEAGNADAQLILKLMKVQEQFNRSPALVAQVQASIDLLKARMTDPA